MSRLRLKMGSSLLKKVVVLYARCKACGIRSYKPFGLKNIPRTIFQLIGIQYVCSFYSSFDQQDKDENMPRNQSTNRNLYNSLCIFFKIHNY